MNTITLQQILKAVSETLYMSIVSTIFVFIFGLILGIVLYITNEGNLASNKFINTIMKIMINTFRSIPFIILIILLLPFTKVLVGTMIGPIAFIPPLVIGASPFYARIVENSFNEIDRNVIDATKAMGATNFQIITKVLLREALPSLLAGITLTMISIVGYTAMAGTIGGGGLGQMAYTYGIVKNQFYVVLIASAAALLIVLTIQFIGDLLVKKIDKR
ncbi:MAG: methionine ABC transporter permease [Bacilli bacterium]